jgi:hypothetical protein
MAYVVRMEPPSDTSEPALDTPEPRPTRPGLVALVAVLAELVVIAALGNQWITPKIFRAVINERSLFVSDLKASLSAFNWRFLPPEDDHAHVWLGQVLLIGTTVALTAVFVTVVVRGPASFGRVFLTCLLAVTVATVVGAYVRGFTNESIGTSDPRLQRALFSSVGPNTITLFAGITLGIVVGLVTAWVTRALRDGDDATPVGVAATASPEPAHVDPEQPPPFFPDPPRTRPSPTASRFPRPPDDEDLDHTHE